MSESYIDTYKGYSIFFKPSESVFLAKGLEFKETTFDGIKKKIEQVFNRKIKPYEAVRYNTWNLCYEKVEIISITRHNSVICGKLDCNEYQFENVFTTLESFDSLVKLDKLAKKIKEKKTELLKKNRVYIDDIAKKMGYSKKDLENL